MNININIFIASVGIIRSHHEKMKQMCEQQLNVLDKVDSGYPSWKGDLLKHLSSACLNLARLVSILCLGKIIHPKGNFYLLKIIFF